MSDALQSLKCSQCGGGPLTDHHNGTVSCPYCGSTFVHPERVCPHCETVNEPDARQCVACGEQLKEPCARCGALNWALASYCQRCGAALDVLEHIAARRSQTDADRLQSLQAQAPRIKEETERFLQAQKEQMWAQERKRLETLAKNQAEQQRQERLIWSIAAAAIVIMVIVIVALTLIAQIKPH